MTTDENDLNRTEAAAPPTERRVGYCSPPIEHRFKKGNRAQSEGKRRKVKGAGEVLPQLPADSLHAMLMLEAQRMVRVKAGGRWVEIPMIQAALREVGMRAAKGNRLAMATIARLMMQSSAEQRIAPDRPRPPPPPAREEQEEQSPLMSAEEYKAVWSRVLLSGKAVDLHLVTPTPHPDDVKIAGVRETVEWPGSQPGDTLSLDGLATTHAMLQEELPRCRQDVEAMEEGPKKIEAWAQWFALHDTMMLIGRHLPERYAGQIDEDARTEAEMLRDHSLRRMADFDRERLREREAAAEGAVEAEEDKD